MEFDAIYQAYFKAVYQYIRRLSGNEHIAEEITSDTFFKAMKAIDDFRGDCDIRVWLCQIAKNTYYSHLKKDRRMARLETVEPASLADPDALEETLDAQEQARLIRNLLHELPEPYKEVFMWRVFGDLPFKEIGALYNKTDNWACVTYHRARKRIQRRLEEISREE